MVEGQAVRTGMSNSKQYLWFGEKYMRVTYGRITSLELVPKRRCLRADNKQMMCVLTIRGIERAEQGGNLLHFV